MPLLDDPLFPVTPAAARRMRNRIAAARLSAELGCEVTPNPDFPGTFDARDPAPGVWLLTGTLDELRAETRRAGLLAWLAVLGRQGMT
jgi:hypothetical protein